MHAGTLDNPQECTSGLRILSFFTMARDLLVIAADPPPRQTRLAPAPPLTTAGISPMVQREGI